jgi:hypothetical protein
VDTDCIAQKVPLELSGRVISANLIVLSGQGIDMILGMRWMKLHQVILDIATRLLHVYSPVHGKVTQHLPAIARFKDSLHHVVERRLEDIHVVHEFLVVFPENLLGMPPKWAIEFKIELQLNTAPLAKAPYKMSPLELAELKIQP